MNIHCFYGPKEDSIRQLKLTSLYWSFSRVGTGCNELFSWIHFLHVPALQLHQLSSLHHQNLYLHFQGNSWYLTDNPDASLVSRIGSLEFPCWWFFFFSPPTIMFHWKERPSKYRVGAVSVSSQIYGRTSVSFFFFFENNCFKMLC